MTRRLLDEVSDEAPEVGASPDGLDMGSLQLEVGPAPLQRAAEVTSEQPDAVAAHHGVHVIVGDREEEQTLPCDRYDDLEHGAPLRFGPCERPAAADADRQVVSLHARERRNTRAVASPGGPP